jgi:hypothetical protein
MMIIGCDLHTRYQQIAMVDTETGELVQRATLTGGCLSTLTEITGGAPLLARQSRPPARQLATFPVQLKN